ncbi:MAG: AraC family transcriptional regulator [Verrucomicrobiae bacterium]|nr:AraC family transcriptional regulator [Verrucomicrobiae bacterium]
MNREPLNLAPGAPSLDFHRGLIQAFVNLRGSYRIDPHLHPHYELLYIIRGTRGFKLHGHVHHARRGDLMIFRPGESHEEFSRSKTISYIVVRFTQAELVRDGIVFPSADKLGPVLRLPWRDRFLDLFTRLMDEHENPVEGAGLLVHLYLTEFIVLLQRAISQSASLQSRRKISGHNQVQAAIKIIQTHLHAPLRIADLARRVFMTDSHFTQSFREQTGSSPKNFLLKERIDRAKELLAATHQPAGKIALSLGYESPFFFYRQFKKKTGLTAGQYRRRFAAKKFQC